ncbi:SDR family oxidoreductase [Gayadomonas joobiniege]|uniref:SDR family oxidoreductase n=1 Tax=Gayadomonas joobiniege TaxID=1234606 RepID=UPI00037DAC69|nr:SDR family oxidoreductase [Gayadomonas joobiniege]
MDLKLKNKVVVVSGAAGLPGSIGQTMIASLADEGALPVLLCQSERGYQYEQDLKARGIDALFIQLDMCDPVAIENAVTQILNKYQRIDAVINNVGVNDGVGLDASYDEFMQSIKVNLASYFMLVKCALPALKESCGNILNIGSKVAMTGQGGTSGYAAAKGGVLGLTREWAVDLVQYQIRVNAILIAECWTPGYQQWLDGMPDGEQKRAQIENKIPLCNRMSTPQEIADTALFVLSERSSHTTGQFVHVDGGYVHLDRALLTAK